MTDFLATVASGTAVLALLAGCAGHAARPAALPAALRAHRVVPGRAVPAVALAAAAAEGLLGLGGAAALATGHRTALAAVLAAATAVFGAYAAYARYVVATGRGGPCGCAGGELPMSGWVAVRALAFALCALTGAAAAGIPGPAPPHGTAEAVTAPLAALTLAVLLWTLPAALHDPAARTDPGGPQWTSRPAP